MPSFSGIERFIDQFLDVVKFLVYHLLGFKKLYIGKTVKSI